MTAGIIIEGGITIEGGIAIGPAAPPTVPTSGYWTLNPSKIGNSLALSTVGGISNFGVYATNPETSMVLGALTGGSTLYDVGPEVMFSAYCSQEDPADIPLNLASIGVANYSANLNNKLGSDANSIGFFQNGSVVYNNVEYLAGSLPTFGPGDYLDFAMSIGSTNIQLWVRVNGGNWNNDPYADPGTFSNSIFLPFIGNGTIGDPTAIYPALQPGAQNDVDAMQVSWNTYSIPSGYFAL